MKRSILPILATLLLGALPAHAASVRHAIIVEIDGGRYSETLGDSLHRWQPHLALDLAPLGCVAADFRNEGVTVTVPGTSAVISGTWQALANDGSERSHVPSVFESWRMATGAPATDAWLVVTKSKLAMLARSDHPASGPEFEASASVEADDAAALAKALQVLAGHHPSLMLLHLGDTDLAGHSGNWALYTASIRRADSLVWVLWQAVQADTALAASTALFVTNDHGRHLDSNGGFANHGDDCEGCRHIELLAVGAGLRAGVSSPVRRRQIDIAPTIGALLGFPTPWAQGQVMDELLADPGNPTGAGPASPGGLLKMGPPSPNPSFHGVRLSLMLPAANRVRVEVFDTSGRSVASVFHGNLAAGPHSFTWNGRDREGRRVGPGYYLVRAVDGRAQVTSPIVRLK